MKKNHDEMAINQQANLNLLMNHGFPKVYHAAPLHYLAEIALSGRLASKTVLQKIGYKKSRFRFTSYRADISRGFANYVHLMNRASSPLLVSKLGHGIPHVEISIPSKCIPEDKYLLCRYNIAKNRGGFEPVTKTGRLYGGFKLPVACTREEKSAMLLRYGTFLRGRPSLHVEVLVESSISLPEETEISVFSTQDFDLAAEAVALTGRNWQVKLFERDVRYPRNNQMAARMTRWLRNADARQSGSLPIIEFDTAIAH